GHELGRGRNARHARAEKGRGGTGSEAAGPAVPRVPRPAGRRHREHARDARPDHRRDPPPQAAAAGRADPQRRPPGPLAHCRAGQAVKEARFRAGAARLGPPGEPWRPGRVLFYPSREFVMPTLVVDVSEVFERKMEAVRAHASQLYDPQSKAPRTTISSAE